MGAFGLIRVPARLRLIVVGYPSGQRGQTVNLLAYAFAGSNPAPTTTFFRQPSPFLSAGKTRIAAVIP